MKTMNKYQTLVLILLLACGGFSGIAAAEGMNETGIPDENTTYLPDVIARLTELSADLNTTGDSLTTTAAADPIQISARLDTLIPEMQTLQTELSEIYTVPESTVLEVMDIITDLQAASLALQEESPDPGSISASLTAASADLAAVNDTLLTLLFTMDMSTDEADILKLMNISNRLSGISSDLNTLADELTPAVFNPASSGVKIQEIAAELETQHTILQNNTGIPEIILQNLAAVITDIRVSADALQESDPDIPAIAANLKSESADLMTVAGDLSVIPTLSPESAENETPKPTLTQDDSGIIIAGDLTEIPTASSEFAENETSAPAGTQDNSVIIIAVISGIGVLAVIIGGVILIKRRRYENNTAADIVSPDVRNPEQNREISTEESVLPASVHTDAVQKSESAEEPVRQTVVKPDTARKFELKHKPVPANPTPSEYYSLVAASIAENHGIMNSASLTPRDLLRITESAPQIQEYIDLYERVRYSGHSDSGDITRLEQLAKRILEHKS
ncbi:MAG: hypothetical protein M0P20_04150 [Methanocorpusculum sp.]|jgi:hypothetical protein|nr:hypothetical protein [Methanocorpusculum sp.]